MRRNSIYIIACVCAIIFVTACKEDAPANAADTKEAAKQVSTEMPTEHKGPVTEKENKNEHQQKRKQEEGY